MKSNLLKMLEALQEAADTDGRPYVVSDGANDWDIDILMEVVAEELDDEDDPNDPVENWGLSPNASSGLALALYDEQGYLNSIPVYQVRFIEEDKE